MRDAAYRSLEKADDVWRMLYDIDIKDQGLSDTQLLLLVCSDMHTRIKQLQQRLDYLEARDEYIY
ncbi:MAG: hypothetical protein V3S69_07955 [Dehalococcoidales bacterium]